MKSNKDEIQKGLGEKIRGAREKLGLTQLEIAAKAGIDVNYYARIERGIANPSYEKLHNIMKALKMNSLDIR